MKAMALTALRRIEPLQVEEPALKPGWVKVKVLHTGICGSDLHYYEHGRVGDFVVEFPFILGHESAGEVVAVGEGVHDLAPGDRVTLEPGIPCGRCRECRTGRYNLCPDVIFFATPPVPGTLQQYVVHPADLCFKLPDNVSTLAGALAEPLAVGFHACRQGGAVPGMTAAVLGCGCIGLCTAMALFAHGVTDVFMTDRIPLRLEAARSLHAKTVDITARDPVDTIRAWTHGRGADLVVDTTGNALAALSTARLVAAGGTVVMVGLAPDPTFPFDFGALQAREATVKTVFRYRNLYPTVVAALAAGLPIERIVNRVFSFDETDAAFAFNSAHRDEVVKAVIAYE